ncbi:helix-turn-helix domain-containing protein [Paraburkholderia tropica]|uniref:helix-turn-helix domain-containing protein n=1 Tax=Paraburkholderia tropica TaxID=92647 RepID=UPI002AB6BFA4|nr:helix-turn-helix domain-containing protein [Paraburkholderia tropica]
MRQDDTVKTIGIALFDGFALPRVARIVEALQRANELAGAQVSEPARFNVALLSTLGGRIAASSSVYVWTESMLTTRAQARFHALFVADGPGVDDALRDETLIGWLRRAAALAEHVIAPGDGQRLLDAAGHRRAAAHGLSASGTLPSFQDIAAPLPDALHEIVEQALGAEAAHSFDAVAADAARGAVGAFSTIGTISTISTSAKMRASARWLKENCHRPVSIDEAAQFVTMSERNFLRRFKAEFGLTPSDYLLYVRLHMACRLLADTVLPIDTIARRCGVGSGGALAKLFRRHFGETPSTFRTLHTHHRPADASERGQPDFSGTT